MIIHHKNESLDKVLNMVMASAAYHFVIPSFLFRDDSFLYSVEVNNSNIRGIVYKFNSHDTPAFAAIDKCIMFNQLTRYFWTGKKMISNPYVCSYCELHEVFVAYTFNDIETFCIHSSYFDDEFMCLIN